MVDFDACFSNQRGMLSYVAGRSGPNLFIMRRCFGGYFWPKNDTFWAIFQYFWPKKRGKKPKKSVLKIREYLTVLRSPRSLFHVLERGLWSQRNSVTGSTRLFRLTQSAKTKTFSKKYFFSEVWRENKKIVTNWYKNTANELRIFWPWKIIRSYVKRLDIRWESILLMVFLKVKKGPKISAPAAGHFLVFLGQNHVNSSQCVCKI